MSYPMNGDFEVHPRGTTNELRVVRQFVKELSEAVNKNDNNLVRELTAKINLWYAGHVQSHPL